MRRNYAIVCVSIILLSIRKNHCFKSKPTDASAVSLCLQTLEGLTILGMGDVEGRGRGRGFGSKISGFVIYLWLCKVVLNVLWVQISIFSWQIRWLDPPTRPFDALACVTLFSTETWVESACPWENVPWRVKINKNMIKLTCRVIVWSGAMEYPQITRIHLSRILQFVN